MKKQITPPAPPFRPGYGKRIRAMKPGGYELFDGANPASIKSIAWRIGFALGRTYATEKGDDGVSVWRIK
jgi:hypothetical protein